MDKASIINSNFNNNGFMIVYIQLKSFKFQIDDKKFYQFDNQLTTPLNFNGEQNITSGYYVLLLPNFQMLYSTPDNPDIRILDYTTFYNRSNASPDLYNATAQPFSLIAQKNFSYTIDDNNFIHIYDDGSTLEKNIFVTLATDEKNNEWAVLFCKNVYDFEQKIIQIYTNEIDYDTNINKNLIYENIGKIYKNPYHNLQLKSPSGTKLTVYPEYINKELEFWLSYTWSPESWHIYYVPRDNYDDSTLHYIYNQSIKYEVYFSEIAGYGATIFNNAFNNFWASGQNQFNQQARINQRNAQFAKAEGAEKIIGGIMGAGMGIATGNPLGILGGLLGGAGAITSGAQQIANSENAIKMQKAQIADLKNTPQQIKGDGNDMNGLLTKINLSPILYEMKLFPALKRQVAQHFHLFGSNLSGQFKYINEFIGSRYHFNFIKCASTFENFKETIPLTNETRQIFNKSNANGVTIWHYRDKATFRGIKNYDVNNVETKYATLT